MTPEEFIAGLRERGFFVMRMLDPPTTILPRIDTVDPLAAWLRDVVGCHVQEYLPEQFTRPHKRSYEVRLHTAKLDYPDRPLALYERAVRIWEAAA